MIGRDYFKEYLIIAPFSLAVVRAIECRILNKLEFKHPVLDVGTGDGIFASILFKDRKIEQGIDILLKEIECAKKRKVYNNLKLASALNIPFENDSFSTVFSNCVLEHIPEIDKALQEFSRVLKKEGYIIFTVPSDIYRKQLFFSTLFRKMGLKKLSIWYGNKINSFCVHYNLFSPEEWSDRLRKAGFEVEKTIRYLSPEATRMHDLMMIFAILPMIFKKVFGRMILFPSIRKYIDLPIIRLLFNKYYISDNQPGSSLIIVAKKI